MSRRTISTLSVLFGVSLLACTASTDPAPPVAERAPAPTTPPSATPTPVDTTKPAAPPPPPVQGMAEWGPEKCAAAGTKGFAVGESLGDLAIRDCETGAPASLDEVCGASATWIFSAHTHCPTCRATAGFTDEVATATAGKNVAVVHLVYDDNGTSCAKWKEAYKLAGIPNVRVYDDPNGAAFAKLKTSNYTAPSAFLDKNRKVTFKEHGLSKAEVLEQIDAALAK